jgi:signal transduction histidine kinase/ActR/RegA family two-component response regulator
MRLRVPSVLVWAGSLTALLGLAVVGGWILGIERVTSVIPGLDPMAFSTAIAFAVLGVSLLAFARGWPRVASAAALLVVTYGIVTLAQHAFDQPYRFDPLLLAPTLSQSAGRASPNAGLGLLLCGLGVTVLALGSRLVSRLFGAMLAASALVIALVDLLAYLLAANGHQGNLLLPQMALHAALGVALASGALLHAGWFLPRGLEQKPLARLGFWAGAVVFLCSVLLAQLLRSNERSQIRRMVQVAAHGVADQLQRALEARVADGEELAASLGEERSPAERARFARSWASTDNRSVAWLVSGGARRWLVSGADSTGSREEWWPDSTLIARARADRKTIAVLLDKGARPWLGTLTPDAAGGTGAMLWVVIDFHDQLSDILTSVTGRFSVVVRSGSTELMQRGVQNPRAEKIWGTTAPVRLGGIHWEVAAWPTPGALAAARSILPLVTLAAGTIVGLLLGLSTALSRLARERTIDLQRTNDRLTSEIRERESVQAALLQREEELRQAHKLEAVGRLTGGIAHDYNNILTVIRSNARSLLLREGATGLVRDALEHIDRAAARGSLLTVRLLAFSQRQLLQPETFSIGDLVASLRDELSQLLGPHVRLLMERAPGVDLVHLDRRWITQVILDLAFNGREAMLHGGTLWLRTRVADEALRTSYGVTQVTGPAMVLEIEDSGRGMDEATRERLFEPFFSTKRFGQGSGLALASAYGIVRQSGGEIAVLSKPERGTRVAIFLPLVDGPTPEVSEIDLAGVTVLVAEDEPGILRFIRRTLESAGCRVIAGGSAEAALEALAQGGVTPDLLVSDIVMPGRSGVDLADEVRRHRPGTAVLFVSAYTSDALKQRGIESLGAYLLQKPFTGPELLEQAGRALQAMAARHGSPPA